MVDSIVLKYIIAEIRADTQQLCIGKKEIISCMLGANRLYLVMF